MKRVLFFISILMAFSFTNSDTIAKSTAVVVTPESSVLVRGTTNVSTFTCDFNINQFKNPISVDYYIEGNKMIFNKTALVLDANCFDCGGKAINKDFKKVLKADKYPKISLYINEISEINSISRVQASIDIELAGVTKNQNVLVNIKEAEADNILITGDLRLRLSDYNLEAFKKFMGLVYVNDEIDIYFQLNVKEK